jgi:predicted metal-dependent HD superfamily phosphohydrolase
MMHLLERWRQLLINFSVSGEAGTAVFEGMLIRYGEDGRYYHTLDHVIQVLDAIAELRPLAQDYTAVQLAAWFHDIIYNPQMADNEAQSAAYAESVLMGLSVPAETIRKVSRMILATAEHTNPTHDPDTYLLLDADLAILGSNEAGYLAYSQAIRLEYSHVPEAAYKNGRIAALNRFLKRPRIYYTPLLYERLEIRARENMIGEIGRLS